MIFSMQRQDAHVHLSPEERCHAEMVVRRYGHFSLVHFALGNDKYYYWSKTYRSFIAYRVVLGVALILGDPIGPEDEREMIICAFRVFCQQQDWWIVFYQASPQTYQLCQNYALSSYKIGEEAIIDVSQFSLQGKSGSMVRHAIARAKRAGITIQCWHGESIPEVQFAGMKHLSSKWIKERKLCTQFGFSMGRFPLDWSPDLLTLVALDGNGEVQAFLTWTPMYAGDGWALDVMRRGKDTAPGTVEFLIAEAVCWAQKHGYQQMSLGLVPLAGLMTSITSASSTSFVERSAVYLQKHGLLLGQYRSLYAFKAKFQPHWEARYLIVNERQALFQVMLALAYVHGYTIRTFWHEMWSAVNSSKVLTVFKQMKQWKSVSR